MQKFSRPIPTAESEIHKAEFVLSLLRAEHDEWSHETLSEEVASTIVRVAAQTISNLGYKVKFRVRTTESFGVEIICSNSAERDFIFQKPAGGSFRRIPKEKVPFPALQAAGYMADQILESAIRVSRIGAPIGWAFTITKASEAMETT